MPDNYDHRDTDHRDTETHGGAFMLGLLAGAVLGVGLGMLLAPKSGAELREDLNERGRDLGHKASERYRKAAESATGLAEKGRELAEKVRDTASRGVAEVKSYADAVSHGPSGPNGGTVPGDFGRS